MLVAADSFSSVEKLAQFHALRAYPVAAAVENEIFSVFHKVQ